MSELGYDQSFKLIDLKLALGYLSALIAGGLYLADKKYKFNDIYGITVTCVIVYGIISLILVYFTSGKYKNNKYIGYNDSKQKVAISTWTKGFEPVYYMRFSLNDDNRQTSETQIKFNEVFDGLGYLNQSKWSSLMKKEIEKLHKKKI